MLRHRKGDALAKKAVKKAVTKKVLTRKVMKKAKGGGGIGTTAGRPLGGRIGPARHCVRHWRRSHDYGSAPAKATLAAA
ncbi:MAG: hypothetical protein FJ303_21705 [Planctomycetes bacterium]|nr:hypothetical protein [Planctomycetota bacterium]